MHTVYTSAVQKLINIYYAVQSYLTLAGTKYDLSWLHDCYVQGMIWECGMHTAWCQHVVYMEVRGQLWKASSLLCLWGFPGWSLGYQTWVMVLFLTEPPHRALTVIYKLPLHTASFLSFLFLFSPMHARKALSYVNQGFLSLAMCESVSLNLDTVDI